MKVNMFKGLVLAAAVAVASIASAEDSYLWFMVQDTNPLSAGGWSYAKVNVSDGAGSSSYLCWAQDAEVDEFSNYGGIVPATQLVVGSQYLTSGYSFLVELYNDGDERVGYSSSVLGSTLASMATGSIGDIPSDVAEFGSFTVPEPTGGMLALLGFGLLALRRKQKNL